jgi:hypothetical protein
MLSPTGCSSTSRSYKPRHGVPGYYLTSTPARCSANSIKGSHAGGYRCQHLTAIIDNYGTTRISDKIQFWLIPLFFRMTAEQALCLGNLAGLGYSSGTSTSGTHRFCWMKGQQAFMKNHETFEEEMDVYQT